MQKSTQNKLIIICIALGIIFITLIGNIYIREISNLSDMSQIKSITNRYLVISAIAFISTTIISSEVLKKMINKSMVSIVKDAGKIVTGEGTNVRLLQEGTKSRNELMNAFDDATLEIREHLRDVDKQKKQIETILLYMTDGIVAFNLEGEVTHKNLAAEKLLNLSKEDDSFEKIFSRLDVEINLEKIIYGKE